jgi:transcriptional regulator with XRE-family HTH domain
MKPLLIAIVECLPEALIDDRKKLGLTQRELAERLGVKEQQIQRYEATRYQSASLKRIVEVAEAMYCQPDR